MMSRMGVQKHRRFPIPLFWGATLLFCFLAASAKADSTRPLDPRFNAKPPLPEPEPVLERQTQLPVSPDFENQVVEFFTKDSCERVRSIVPRKLYRKLSPLVAAVVAYCQPNEADAEALFKWAEERDPSHDTIYVLHARYLWKLHPEQSIPLWAKVVLITRNPATKFLAQQYLNGTAVGDEAFSIAKRDNLLLMIQAGASREANPTASGMSLPQLPSAALNVQGAANYSRTMPFGLLTATYNFFNNRYFTAHSADLMEHDLETQLALRVGTDEDVVFRPFGSYLTYGDQPYQSYAGFSVRGIAYRESYKSYMQGSIYKDWYYKQEFVNQAGTHFRFDYNWELFPFPWFESFTAWFEHVKADRDTDNADAITITYSHNDVGVQSYTEYNFGPFTTGLTAKLYFRADDDTSTYPNIFGTQVTKRRRDILLEAIGSVVVPLRPDLQIYLWAALSRTMSTMGQNDYADYNIRNQVFGAALRAFVLK